MRARAAAALILLLLLAAAAGAPAALAEAPGVVATQEEGVNESNEENQPAGEQGGPEEEGEPEAETGAGEGEQEGAEAEEGPLWTYQMVWLSLGLLLLLGLALARWYYMLVTRRTRV